MPLIPYVVEGKGREERVFDIYSRLLRDRIIFLGTSVNDEVANSLVAQMLYLQSERKRWLFCTSACIGLSALFKFHVAGMDFIGFALLLSLREQGRGPTIPETNSLDARAGLTAIRLLRAMKILGIFGFFAVFGVVAVGAERVQTMVERGHDLPVLAERIVKQRRVLKILVTLVAAILETATSVSKGFQLAAHWRGVKDVSVDLTLIEGLAAHIGGGASG